MILGIIFIILGGFLLIVGVFNLQQFIPHARMQGLVRQVGADGVRLVYIVFGLVILVSGINGVS